MADNKKIFEPLQAIGIFWSGFGVLILIGVFFSPENLGKVINGLAGTIFLLVGIGAFLKGAYNKKKI